VILRRLDVAVVNVEAMSEGDGGTRLDVGLDVVGPDGALVLVGGQDHDHVGLGGSLGHGLDLEALLLGEVDRLGGRTQADDHVNTGIAQVQRVGVALGAVADDCDFLAFEDGKIAVVLIPDLCCHYWHSFSVVGCDAAGRQGIYGVQISPVLRGLCPSNRNQSYPERRRSPAGVHNVS
jgi:hypothetical protein